MAIALGTPFISGKDSLNNEFRPLGASEPISIPPSLLISALGQVDDVGRCVTMDLKEPGNLLYLVGLTKDELGGSHFALVEGLSGGEVPKVDRRWPRKPSPRCTRRSMPAGPRLSRPERRRPGRGRRRNGLRRRLGGQNLLDRGAARRRSCRPRESKAGGEARAKFPTVRPRPPCCSANRTPASSAKSVPSSPPTFEAALSGVPHARIGEVTADGRLEILTANDPVVSADVSALKEAWQNPLRW